MKRFVLGMALLSLLMPTTSQTSSSVVKEPSRLGAAPSNLTLKVYNCEDYIYEDEETGETLVDKFEKYYEETHPGVDITVQYDTYATNEAMYNQVVKLNNHYDIVVASDYMIEKMKNEGHLEPMDASKLPNYTKYCSPYLNNIFEENGYNGWSAAYMWGTMGFIYNPELVAYDDVMTWDIMWNKKYANKVSVKDSMRDTYVAGLFRAYKDVFKLLQEQLEAGIIDDNYYVGKVNEYFNRCDDETIAAVEYALKTMKDNIYGFEVDSGKNDIVTGKITVNLAWSGDAAYSIELAKEENNMTLKYAIPEEGSNVWFDGFCMPKGANTELAQAFIDYCSMPENAVLNMDYIGYTTSIVGDQVIDYLHEMYDAPSTETNTFDLDLSYFFGDSLSPSRSPIIKTFGSDKQGSLETRYPTEEIIKKCGMMHDYGKQNEKVIEMWTRVRASEVNVTTYIVLGVIVLGAVGYGIYALVKSVKAKKRRERRRALSKQ